MYLRNISRNQTHLPRGPRALALTTAALLALGGAGAAQAEPAAPAAPAVTVTEPTAPSAPSAPSPEQAVRVAAERTPATALGPWSEAGADTSAYDPTLPLSAVVLDIDGATGSSPQQVALFDHGVYIGTTVTDSYPFQHVSRVADNIIRVDYRFLLPGDATADPGGVTTSHFVLHWQGVERTGALPPRGAVPPAE